MGFIGRVRARDAEQFARIHPPNDLILSGVVEKLLQDGRSILTVSDTSTR
ncbi:hypothetical protein PY365_18920 [Roseiarcaceae bacterium H3SJ34-1]|nr:hypothetical protein [Roseiarcaceae bacterium H3SJ34-1]